MGDRVFIDGRAAVHKGSAGSATCFPDVCLCPPSPPAGPVPTPLPNQIVAADLQAGAQSVFIEGNPVGKLSSHFAKSAGNEVSRPTGGGVLTATAQGKAYFTTGSVDVLIEGEPAVRHLDLVTGNHMAKAPGNTPPAPWLSMAAPPTPGQPAKPLEAPAKDAELVKKRRRIVLALQQTSRLEWSGARYRLTASGEVFEGELTGSGRLQHLVLAETTEAKLELFRKGATPVREWKLAVKPELPAVSSIEGAQVRLNNLGFEAGPPTTSMNGPTRAAVTSFQAAYHLQTSGRLDAATLNGLTSAHDAHTLKPSHDHASLPSVAAFDDEPNDDEEAPISAADRLAALAEDLGEEGLARHGLEQLLPFLRDDGADDGTESS